MSGPTWLYVTAHVRQCRYCGQRRPAVCGTQYQLEGTCRECLVRELGVADEDIADSYEDAVARGP